METDILRFKSALNFFVSVRNFYLLLSLPNIWTSPKLRSIYQLLLYVFVIQYASPF